MSLLLQSVPINASSSSHHYKSAFYDLISTSNEEKDTGSTTLPYFYESALEVGKKVLVFVDTHWRIGLNFISFILQTSESFKKRMNLFKNAAQTKFEATSVVLLGQLHHDLLLNKAG